MPSSLWSGPPPWSSADDTIQTFGLPVKRGIARTSYGARADRRSLLRKIWQRRQGTDMRLPCARAKSVAQLVGRTKWDGYQAENESKLPPGW